MAFASVEEQLAVLTRGCERIDTLDELRGKLERSRAADKPLRIKLGLDPTAPDIHLGHTVVLRKMRQFQDLGHKAVLIIGDYTARIGDPTGQNKTRPMLSEADIERNAQTYFDQAGKILDTAPDKLETCRNSEWLAKMSFADVIRLASQMTVARMLERDTFAKRHKSGEPISVHEFLYPLMQGHDSVEIKSDVELGGTDQTFNNLVGRDLQRHAGQEPQIVMILPILEGLDGVEKMSKSKGNYIGIAETARDMFGKTMSIGDDLMWKWYALLFFKTPAEIAALKKLHPMEAKKALAHAIVAQYHGVAAADRAREDFEKQFSTRDLKEVARVLPVPAGEIWIIELIEKAHKFGSRSEIRRLIQGGGVSIDGQKVTDEKTRVPVRDGMVLKVGKLIVVKLAVA